MQQKQDLHLKDGIHQEQEEQELVEQEMHIHQQNQQHCLHNGMKLNIH